ncbi:MAG: diaminopimelate epimerase [Mycobacteriales bacterium]
MSLLRFVKGHGTENDFVLLPDADLPLTPDLVRALCDRRAGIGGDGVLRVEERADGWFMDYRNADGQVAEMCGNGLRVFARHLVDAGLADPGTLPILTRAGVRTVQVPATGDVTVEMGVPAALEASPSVDGLPGTAVSMGNPHVVVELADLDRLAGLDLSRPPVVRPPLPDGQNVEYVVRRGPRALALRVHERGVGETRSCGTGVCAAVVAAVAWSGGNGLDDRWTVDVPGGRLSVTWLSAGPVLMSGPAVLVARGEVDTDAL